MKYLNVTILILFFSFSKVKASEKEDYKVKDLVSNFFHQQLEATRDGLCLGVACSGVSGVFGGYLVGGLLSIPTGIFAGSLVAPVAVILNLDHPVDSAVEAMFGTTFFVSSIGGSMLGIVTGMSSVWGGAVVGTMAGASLGAAKGVCSNFPLVPTAIKNQLLGSPTERRHIREEKVIEGLEVLLEREVKIANSEGLQCLICLEPVDTASEFYYFKDCQCEDKGICPECKDFFLLNLKGGTYPIKCPGACSATLSKLELRHWGLDEDAIKKYRIHTVNALAAKAGNFYFCSTINCINGKVVDDDDTLLACELCGVAACVMCGQNHSSSDKCSRVDQQVQQILMKGVQKPCDADPELGTIRPCYWCGKLINRADGCNIVKCTECGREFHWNKGDRKGQFHDFSKDVMSYSPIKKPHL